VNYNKSELIYEGKAKKIYNVKDHDDLIWQEFKDSFTAFNGEKKAEMADKGRVNRQIASLIFQRLKKNNIPSHWVADSGEIHMITKKLKMIDLEVVVRNILAGSTAKKFQIPEGTALEKPLVEFYYKKDALGDPFISDDQAMMLKTVRKEEDLKKLKSIALDVNNTLLDMFAKAGILLVDFKIEFGYDSDGEILLGDEISPDSCRLWDKATNEKMDKDRFRRDLGQVVENYKKVLDRLMKGMEL
jgi:phosphoribosylaminoimidazole-succinocarboxamide synthase